MSLNGHSATLYVVWSSCPNKYGANTVLGGNGCWKYVSGDANWNDAVSICEDLGMSIPHEDDYINIDGAGTGAIAKTMMSTWPSGSYWAYPYTGDFAFLWSINHTAYVALTSYGNPLDENKVACIGPP